jgi:hypothetical protein
VIGNQRMQLRQPGHRLRDSPSGQDRPDSSCSSTSWWLGPVVAQEQHAASHRRDNDRPEEVRDALMVQCSRHVIPAALPPPSFTGGGTI